MNDSLHQEIANLMSSTIGFKKMELYEEKPENKYVDFIHIKTPMNDILNDVGKML